MTDKKKLENEDLIKVSGGSEVTGVHHFEVGDFVEYTWNGRQYCYHIRSLVNGADAYRATEAVKIGNKVSYDNKGVNFNGGPSGVTKTKSKERPSWCKDLV